MQHPPYNVSDSRQQMLVFWVTIIFVPICQWVVIMKFFTTLIVCFYLIFPSNMLMKINNSIFGLSMTSSELLQV